MLFLGDYFNLMRDMRDLRELFFYTSFRMTLGNFDRLLAKINREYESKVRGSDSPFLLQRGLLLP